MPHTCSRAREQTSSPPQLLRCASACRAVETVAFVVKAALVRLVAETRRRGARTLARLAAIERFLTIGRSDHTRTVVVVAVAVVGAVRVRCAVARPPHARLAAVRPEGRIAGCLRDILERVFTFARALPRPSRPRDAGAKSRLMTGVELGVRRAAFGLQRAPAGCGVARLVNVPVVAALAAPETVRRAGT